MNKPKVINRTTHIYKEDWEFLSELKRQTGVPVSDVIRTAVRKEVEKLKRGEKYERK